MKILYDHQAFTDQNYGGISRYFSELLKYFRKAGDPDFKLSLRYSNNYHLDNIRLGGYRNFFKNYDFRGRFRLMTILNREKSKRVLSSEKFDIFHPTYYDPYFLKHIGCQPFILTIYDMIHEVFPSAVPPNDKIFENVRLLAKKAIKLIAISENTKRDVIRFVGINEDKIKVIHLGNSLPGFSSAQSVELPIKGKYILFVGIRDRYKNFIFLLKSIVSLMEKDGDLNIVCIGGGPFSDSEKNVFKDLKVEERVYYFSPSDKEMTGFYQNALAFVFPSLYEGFGIPVLEAFASGCPAILSNTSSLPEVGGEAAIYFDPKSEISLRETVNKVIYDEELRSHLKSKGFKQLQKFSWEKTIKETEEVYRSIL